MNRKRFNSKKHETVKTKPAVQHELATIEEASEFLRVHHKTVRRRLKAGKLPGSRLPGGQWRLPWAKLREMVGVN